MEEKSGSSEVNEQSVTITKEIIDGLMETVRNLYLCDDIPWVIGYSGGKDSTATLSQMFHLPEGKKMAGGSSNRIFTTSHDRGESFL